MATNRQKGIVQLKSKGISPLKLKQLMKKGGKSFRLNAFYPAYQEYVSRLTQQGAMDFDDLILNAISLLETQPQIREKYQAQYRYIIEDEAQDSSLMLQRFIQLLGGEGQGKRANLIRTGDPNQSITTTFSSADPTVFLNFIQRADLVVEMNASARCAAPILGLANEWIRQCEGHPVLKGAFQP
ncbi:MAG: ATP-dependent helicase, partial [Cyanobacteria bacterium]|nr:ATP-dependent helicase [Cyanobacteriota bacterium]